MVHHSHVTHYGKNDERDADIARDSRELDIEAQSESQTPSHDNVPASAHLALPTHSAHNNGDIVRPPIEEIRRAETIRSRLSHKSTRRRPRAETSTAYGAAEMGRTTGWTPGQEPGIDTSEAAPAYTTHEEVQENDEHEKLQQQCEITVVDYSLDNMVMRTLDNDNLKDFLEQPTDDWSQVRWINVNGLSWDVIKVLGHMKGLHRLAIEDLMNTRNRTKADFYSDHTFLVLPLQRLVNVDEHRDYSDDESMEEPDIEHEYDEYVPKHLMSKMDSRPEVVHERKRRTHALQHMKQHRGAIETFLREVFLPKKHKRPPSAHRNQLHAAHSFKKPPKVKAPWLQRSIRTLQQYHTGPNQDRIDFMERNSTLGKRGLGVSVEQVAIFLLSDNTVLSFFEYSAQEIERPIIRRLNSMSTILRQSCDASMLMQSIIDTIVDLAIPVTTAYQDAIGDLELAVLTHPDISESTALYILASELSVLRSAIAPIGQLISTLKEHKPNVPAFTVPSRTMSPMPETAKTGILERPPLAPGHQRLPTQLNLNSGATISPMTIMYLSDVDDHVILIQDSYDQMRRNADNLVDLIFNTVSAYQNEFMKQLTVVTAFFLPLSFMTGYFGMNFGTFPAATEHSDAYFWAIAGPVCFVVILLLLGQWLIRWFRKIASRALIRRNRKQRLENAKRR